MRLCYVIPWYQEDVSSHYYYNYLFVKALAKKMDVFVVIERSTSRPKLKNVRGVYIRKMPSSIPPLVLVELFFVFLFLRARGYKLFYVHQSCASAGIASLVTKLLGGATLQWHCGAREKIPLRLLISLNTIDFLVTGNCSMKKYYVEKSGISPTKVKVVPNWIDLERFRRTKYKKDRLYKELNIPRGKKIIVTICQLSKSRNAQSLPEIIRKVCMKEPSAFFIMIGDGQLRNQIEVEIRRWKLEEKVRMVGKISATEIPRYLAIADLFITPSKREGFPRVVVEAMAMGVPVVVSYEMGGIRDILPAEYQQLVVEPFDVKKFSLRVCQLLRESRLRLKLIKAGIQHIQQYGKSSVLREFLQMLKSIR